MEKDYNAMQRENQTLKKQENVGGKKTEIAAETKKEDKKEIKPEEKKEKKIVKKIKRDEATINGISLPISTKDSTAICRFIKHKSIDKAISDLELVEKLKKAIPMKGEIPHRKGKGIMAGRYMTKPVGFFIRMLKNLKANANMNEMEEPIITEAVPNRASRPYGKGGMKRKRTHIFIKVVEKKKLREKKK
jgi:ribosomal protein L22